MKARFIGADGSMGLVHGRVYNILITSNEDYISVCWGTNACHYINLKTLHENWRAVEEEESYDSLGDMILGLADMGYMVTFEKDFITRSLGIRMLKIGTSFSLLRYIPFSEIKDARFSVVRFMLSSMRKEIDREG